MKKRTHDCIIEIINSNYPKYCRKINILQNASSKRNSTIEALESSRCHFCRPNTQIPVYPEF